VSNHTTEEEALGQASAVSEAMAHAEEHDRRAEQARHECELVH
jgi:hypothetical protein